MNAVKIEIRDRATCIAAVVIYVSPLEKDSMPAFHDRFGSGVMLIRGDKGKCHWSPEDWCIGGRTMTAAHQYLSASYMLGVMVDDGDVIDVRVLLGEEEHAADSELF